MSAEVRDFSQRLARLRADAKKAQDQQLSKLAIELGRSIEVGNVKKVVSQCAAFYLDNTHRIENRVLVFDMMIVGELVILLEGKDDPEARATLFYWGLLMHKYWYGKAAKQLELARERGDSGDGLGLTLGREEDMAERFAHKYVFPYGRLIHTAAFGERMNTSQFTVLLQKVGIQGMPGDGRYQGGDGEVFAEDLDPT